MQPSMRVLFVLACVLFLGAAQANAQDWPQWRGPNRDNNVTGFAEPKTWPKELSKKWTKSVGVGESSPVLVGDKLYVFGRQGDDEVTRCLDAMTGKEIWLEKYAAKFSGGGDKAYPGPRSTPAVGEGKICTLGVNGLLTCRDAVTGKELWHKDKGYPQFHTAASPIIADGKCIELAGTLTAFDLADGTAKWTTSIKAGYGSPVIMTVDGVKQIVTPGEGVLASVDFNDGKALWQVNIGGAWQNNYSTPIVAGNIVYYSISPGKGGKGGKGATGTPLSGFVALKIEKKGDKFAANEIWKAEPAAGYHTPLLRDDLIYGVASQGKAIFCLDAKTGKTKWSDGPKQGECGCILSVGSVLVASSADKDLIVFRPSAKEFSEIARYRVSSSPTWCVPILAGNRIYVKDKAGDLTLWTVE